LNNELFNKNNEKLAENRQNPLCQIMGYQQTVSACSEESCETLPSVPQHAEMKQGFSFLQDRY
jgi:hypothetical protein